MIRTYSIGGGDGAATRLQQRLRWRGTGQQNMPELIATVRKQKQVGLKSRFPLFSVDEPTFFGDKRAFKAE